MSKNMKGIPEGYRTVTPYLTLKEAAKAISFYKAAFGAEEVELHHSPDGRIMHATIRIGDSLIMLSDEFPEYGCGASNPQALKGTTVMLHVYVPNVDIAFSKAVKAGATVKMPVDDMYWGDRYGQIEDPFGHIWSLATHIADAKELPMEQSSMGGCCQGKNHSCS